MLTKAWKKIDRFYAILALVVLMLAAPVIYTALGIFSAFITAYEVDTSVDKGVRVNKPRLEQAVAEVYDKEVPPLEVRETFITVNPEETSSEEELPEI